jgi:hypothetical protein
MIRRPRLCKAERPGRVARKRIQARHDARTPLRLSRISIARCTALVRSSASAWGPLSEPSPSPAGRTCHRPTSPPHRTFAPAAPARSPRPEPMTMTAAPKSRAPGDFPAACPNGAVPGPPTGRDPVLGQRPGRPAGDDRVLPPGRGGRAVQGVPHRGLRSGRRPLMGGAAGQEGARPVRDGRPASCAARDGRRPARPGGQGTSNCSR